MGQIRILGVVGSQRRESYNRLALLAARELVPSGAAIELLELHDIPFFEVRHASRPPPVVVDFRDRMGGADAILFATPECNHGVPGRLKSAIEWASRPCPQNVLKGKPAAVISASVGEFVTARAQHHLYQMLDQHETMTVRLQGTINGKAEKRFGPNGQLVDESTRAFIQKLLVALVGLVKLTRARQESLIKIRA